MANQTPRFGFTTFDTATDSLALHGYKAFGADRVALDRLLTVAVERHVHTGATIAAISSAPPLLSLNSAGGTLPANQAVYYRTSFIDTRGQERIASQPAVAYTPSQLTRPTAPNPTRTFTGTLPPGDYLYALSAYSDTTTHETVVSNAASTNLPVIGGFVLTLPSPPSGATGWNVYRKGPTEYELMFLGSVGVDVAIYTDNGVAASRARTAPAVNSSSTSSSVTISQATPLQPGETLKIYRSYDPTDWEDSLLVWTASLPYTDNGQPTRAGYPPNVSPGVGGAPKIDLGAHTAGSLPPGRAHTTTEINFVSLGPVTIGPGLWQWVNEYSALHLLGFRANLGRDSTPAAQPVIVALERRLAGAGPWERYQHEVGLTDITAEIPVASNVSPVATITPTNVPIPILEPGDALRVAVLQDGGGATPTDENLAVTVTAAVEHGSTTATYTWEI